MKLSPFIMLMLKSCDTEKGAHFFKQLLYYKAQMEQRCVNVEDKGPVDTIEPTYTQLETRIFELAKV